MKLIIKFVVLAGIIYLGWTFFLAKSNNQPLVSLTDQSGSISLNVREKEKEEFKSYIKKIKNFIYRQASVHNPEGDILPDNIDESVIEEVKEKIN